MTVHEETAERPVEDHGPAHPSDLAVLDAIHQGNQHVRALLCTLARRGAAMRADEPARAGLLLDALAPWPMFKAGQFLFDLLEWEDFMLDAPAPEPLSDAQVSAAIGLPLRWLTAVFRTDAGAGPLPQGGLALPLRLLTAAVTAAVDTAGGELGRTLSGFASDGAAGPDAAGPGATGPDTADPGTADPDGAGPDDARRLPPLEAGFYLFHDVALGLVDAAGPLL